MQGSWMNRGRGAALAMLIVLAVLVSACAGTGLQQGDVIVAIQGTELRDESALAQAISSHKPGDKVKMAILRDNKRRDVTVTLG